MKLEYLLSLINSIDSPKPAEHTHLEFPQNVDFNNHLKVSHYSQPRAGYFHVSGSSLFFLVDRDGDGNWEQPHPLRLQDSTNQGYVFDNEIYHQGNLPVESGIFTPQILIGRGNSPPIYNQQLGFYSRVGGLCWVSISLSLSSHSFNFGALIIEGLPFLSNQITSLQVFEYNSIISSSGHSNVVGVLPHNKTHCEIKLISQEGRQNYVSLSDISQDFSIKLGGTYAV